MRNIFARRFTKNSAWLVALLAAAGLVVALVILLAGPIVLPPDIVDRASISGAIGGLFALLTAIAAISAAIWINTSDFKAEQSVKADIAKLRASLRMILVKGARWTMHKKGDLDAVFGSELEVVREFANSTTGFGLWAHVDRESEQAGDRPEEWRLFFLYQAQLLDAAAAPGDASLLFHSASWLEELLGTLTRSEIDTISRYVADLAGALGSARKSNDAVLAGMAATYGKGSRFDPLKSERNPNEGDAPGA